MKINHIFILFVVQLFIGMQLNAQENKAEFFIATSGELPTYSISQEMFSQQCNLALGYTFTKNAELFMNMGLGLLGNKSDDLNLLTRIFSYGLGANYLFPVRSQLEIGLEVLAAYGNSNMPKHVNYDHIMCQSAMKIQFVDSYCEEINSLGMFNIYCVMGLRYRSFFNYAAMNGLEYYSGIGMRFGFGRKLK